MIDAEACELSNQGKRCGLKFGNAKCGGGGAAPEPAWAKYCNEANGWCGKSDAHKNAQASTKYDFVANIGGPCDPAPSPPPPPPPSSSRPTPSDTVADGDINVADSPYISLSSVLCVSNTRKAASRTQKISAASILSENQVGSAPRTGSELVIYIKYMGVFFCVCLCVRVCACVCVCVYK